MVQIKVKKWKSEKGVDSKRMVLLQVYYVICLIIGGFKKDQIISSIFTNYFCTLDFFGGFVWTFGLFVWTFAVC